MWALGAGELTRVQLLGVTLTAGAVAFWLLPVIS